MIPLPQNQAAVNWTFEQSIRRLTFDLEIPTLPVDAEGNPSLRGVYIILYDQWLNGVGCYLGLQTNLMRPHPNGGHIATNSPGLLFTRWASRDESNLRVPIGGFSENAGHEGDFIGVRKPFPIVLGRYTITIASGEVEGQMVWYNATVEHPTLGRIDCGAIRFPLVEGENPGLADAGGTNLELYRTTEIRPAIEEQDVPTWSFVINQVIANNGTSPVSARLTYPYRDAVLSSVTVEQNNKVIFLLGNAVARKNDTGSLFP